jgi:hypothetical protein
MNRISIFIFNVLTRIPQLVCDYSCGTRANAPRRTVERQTFSGQDFAEAVECHSAHLAGSLGAITVAYITLVEIPVGLRCEVSNLSGYLVSSSFSFRQPWILGLTSHATLVRQFPTAPRKAHPASSAPCSMAREFKFVDGSSGSGAPSVNASLVTAQGFPEDVDGTDCVDAHGGCVTALTSATSVASLRRTTV